MDKTDNPDSVEGSERQLIARLRDGEERFRQIADAMPQLVWTTRADGHHEYFNERWYEYTGLSREESLGEGWRNAFHPDDLRETERRWLHSLATGEPYEIEYRCRRHDRAWRWFLGRALPVRSATGAIEKWFGTCTDIHDRKTATEERERFFRLSPELLCVVGFDARWQRVNQAVTTTLGWTEAELVGRPAIDVAHPDDKEPALAEIARLATTGEPTLRFELRMLCRDGSYKWLAWSASAVMETAVIYGAGRDITRKRELQEERDRLFARVQQSELHFRGLVENLPELAWTARPDGYIDYYNERWYDYTGASREAMEGWGWQAVHAPELRDAVVARWRRSLAEGTPFEMEFPLRRHDGTYRWFLTRVRPLRDADGTIVRWFGMNIDIDERRQATEQIHKLVTVVEQSADFIGMAALDGGLRYVNDAGRRMTGLGADSALDALTLLDLVAPTDRGRMHDEVLPLVRSRGSWHGEIQFWDREHDKAFPVDHHVFLTRDERSGKALGIATVTRDVADAKAAANKLREEAETLETLHGIGKQLSAELDLETLVQAVTDAATRVSGAQFGAFFYTVHNAQGDSYMLYAISGVPREMFSRFPMPTATPLFAPTFKGEGIVRLDDVTKDPRYGQSHTHGGMPREHLPVVSYLAVPVISRSGAVLGALFFGHEAAGVFTERSEKLVAGLASTAAVAMDNAQLFQDAKRLIHALEKSNKELDEFAYVASHDLKAPLRAIASLSEWLEEDLSQVITDDARRHLQLLRGRVHRLEALIEGILNYSRAGRVTKQPESIDVAVLVRDIVELLGGAASAAVTVGPNLPTVFTDRVRLEQVFMNLIGNALKHAGAVEPKVVVTARDAGEAWEFAVQDNGPGIAPRYHERIWGIFQTLEARDKKESTGIGLSVVRKIVDAQGGRAWVASELGHGATFFFTWPKLPVSKRDSGRGTPGTGEHGAPEAPAQA